MPLFTHFIKQKECNTAATFFLFYIYIPHYSNYLSIFIRYTPTQTEGHIPCLRHQQLYFSDSPVLFPALHLDSPAGTLLQLHLLWGPHRRILSDLHSFRLRLLYCFTAKIPQRTYGIPVFIKISSCHADYFFPGSWIYLASRRCLEAQVSGLQPVSGLRFRWRTELLHGGGSNLYSVSNSY